MKQSESKIVFKPPDPTLKGVARHSKEAPKGVPKEPSFDCSYKNTQKSEQISVEITLHVPPEDLQRIARELQIACLSIIKPNEKAMQKIRSHKIEGTGAIELKFEVEIENASIGTFTELYEALGKIYKGVISNQEATSQNTQ